MGNRPEKKFKCGAVEALVFGNEIDKNGRTVKVWNVVVQKWYLNKDEEWKTTNRFDVNELPKVRLVTEEAYKYITLKESDWNDGSGE